MFHEYLSKLMQSLMDLLYDKREIVRRAALMMIKVFMKNQQNLRSCLIQEQISVWLYNLWKYEKSFKVKFLLYMVFNNFCKIKVFLIQTRNLFK